MLCRVLLLMVLTCAAAQALNCGPCDCYTGDSDEDDVIKWESLKTLKCFIRNSLTSVPGTSVLPADTQVINIQYQNIPIIKQNQFISLTRLQILNMEYCSISIVKRYAFRNMTGVIGISLYNNLISTLPTDLLRDTPNLKEIYLGRNKLRVLQENLFLNLKQLEVVVIFGNEIKTIEENSFVNIPNLNFLNLGDNTLTSLNWNIMNKLMSLNDLYLEDNPWHCDIMLCETMRAYVYSHLSPHGGERPLCTSPAEVIGMDWNEAVVTMCNSTSALQPGERYCGTCRCTDDPVTVTCPAPYTPWIPQKLREGVVKLNISGHNISTVRDNDFHYFIDLQILYLENNNITIIEQNSFEPVKYITTISLGHNKLTGVQKQIFSNLIHLEEVNLSHNELISIEDDCFENLPSLAAVDLSSNRLKTLKVTIFSGVNKMSLLALHDNPWKCDLALCSIMNAVVSRELWAADKEPMCSSPRHVQKKPWSGIYMKFQPSISSSATNVTEGNTVTLQCNYCFASRVRWTFNGKKLPKYQQTISNGTAKLTIEYISKDGEGYYECQVKNCDYCDTDEVLINVTPIYLLT